MRTRALRAALERRGSRSYVSRILQLVLLAPDFVDAMLGGQTDQMLMLAKLERPLSANWEEQRKQFRS
jgi:hypothetical protein